MRWNEKSVCNQAAVYGFTAAYCFAPLPQDGAPEGCRTLILLVRAYRPGGRLVDHFYPASNAAYHQAHALVQLLSQDMQVWPLSNLRLKPICNRLPQFGRGINTLNYLKGIGSRFCLELIGVSDDLIEKTKIINQNNEIKDWNLKCASCNQCRNACPTGAITAEGFVRERCLRNYMLSGKSVPQEFRAHYGVPGEAMGVIGCDICQRVCPYNALPERERQDTDEFTLAELLACAPDTMERFATLYGRNYAIRNRVIAQALLATANSGDSAFLPQITALENSPSPVVAEHARWAATKLKDLQNLY